MTLTILPTPKPRIRHRPYVLLGSLQVIDVFTTGVLLALFTAAAEGNPIARWFTDHGIPGLAVLLAFKLGVVTLTWWCQTGVAVMSGIYSLVIVNNTLALALLLAASSTR